MTSLEAELAQVRERVKELRRQVEARDEPLLRELRQVDADCAYLELRLKEVEQAPRMYDELATALVRARARLREATAGSEPGDDDHVVEYPHRWAGRIGTRHFAVFRESRMSDDDLGARIPLFRCVFRSELGPQVPERLIVRRRGVFGAVLHLFGAADSFDDPELDRLLDPVGVALDSRDFVIRARDVLCEALDKYPSLWVQSNRLQLELEWSGFEVMTQLRDDGLRYAAALEKAAPPRFFT